MIGFSLKLQWHAAILFPIFVIWLPLFLPKSPGKTRLFLGLALMVSAFIFAHLHYKFPSIPHEGVEGKGIFEIQDLREIQNHYGHPVKYSGILRTFEKDDQVIARHIPCTIFVKENYSRPPANCSYIVKGRLLARNNGYLLKISREEPWLPLEGTWSTAEFRFHAKNALKNQIHQSISEPRSADFLTGICIGQFNDKSLAFDFGRLGLQHIMAISGFHFSIIAGIFSIFLRLFLPPKYSALLLLILLTGYFILIGWSPSVERAWIAAVIFFGGYFFEKKGSALNSLGFALIAVCLTNPLNVTQLGFLFSFLSTASILIFYQGADLLLKKVFIQRPLSQMIEMNRLNQHAYLLLCFFRKAAALTFAVHLTALPMMLYYFHKFPLLSFIYNLFFPFLATFSLVLLMIGLLTGAIFPLLGNLFHHINTAYTTFILNITTGVPRALDITIRLQEFPLALFLGYLCILGIAGVFLHRHLKEKQQELNDLLI